MVAGGVEEGTESHLAWACAHGRIPIPRSFSAFIATSLPFIPFEVSELQCGRSFANATHSGARSFPVNASACGRELCHPATAACDDDFFTAIEALMQCGK